MEGWSQRDIDAFLTILRNIDSSLREIRKAIVEK